MSTFSPAHMDTSLRLQKFSYRFAEQVLNSKLALKQEIEDVLENIPDVKSLSRPAFNTLLDEKFVARGWARQPAVFDEAGDPGAKNGFYEGADRY